MRPNNLRCGELPNGGYRQSMSIMSSELARNSYGTESPVPSHYRESLGAYSRARNTMNL